jgi:hypothetical protein
MEAAICHDCEAKKGSIPTRVVRFDEAVKLGPYGHIQSRPHSTRSAAARRYLDVMISR